MQYRTNEEDLVSYGDYISQQKRREQQRSFIIYGIINIVILAYLVFVYIYFEKSWQVPCVKQLSIWLLVYLFIQLAHIIRRIAAVCIWQYAKDPAFE